MRAYFVLSFLVFGLMNVMLAVQNWMLLDWPWRLLALASVPIAAWCFVMVLVALRTDYRR